MLVPVQFYKAEKYALDMVVLPEETKKFFLQNFGCSRKVYNLYVDYLYGELEKAGYESGDDIPEVKLPEVTAFKAKTLSLRRLIPSVLQTQRWISRTH